jgi:hypothetical protein
METKVPYSTRFTNFLFSIVLIAWAPSTTLLAQSFQPEVKGLDSKTFKQPEVKGLSGNSTQPTVQGLNNNMQPNVQGLSSSQSSQQGSSGATSTSSSSTASSSGTGAGSEAMKSGASAGTSSSSRPDKFFTCSRCGIEGAQAQGYCLGNFGMLTNTNGEPLKHVRK